MCVSQNPQGSYVLLRLSLWEQCCYSHTQGRIMHVGAQWLWKWNRQAEGSVSISGRELEYFWLVSSSFSLSIFLPLATPFTDAHILICSLIALCCASYSLSSARLKISEDFFLWTRPRSLFLHACLSSVQAFFSTTKHIVQPDNVIRQFQSINWFQSVKDANRNGVI